MKRRNLIKAAAASAIAPSGLLAAEKTEDQPLSGIQIAAYSIFDEGVERCLDTLQEKAAINALFLYSQTYHIGYTPKNVLATDHGVPVRDLAKSRMPYLWVKHRANAFDGQVVRHPEVTPELEFSRRDLFRELREPTRRRGMKLYARILEAGARRSKRIPGYDKVSTIDHRGKPGHGPCWNNPHYRRWVYTTIRELVTQYELDGLQYGAERTGPLSHVLYRGMTPTCFCDHCTAKNRQAGVDPKRAKEGFGKLYDLMSDVSKAARTGRQKSDSVAGDGVLSAVMRIVYRYPEVLQWDYNWFQADEEICTQIHHIAKEIRPDIDSGRHVDHQRSSWDFFFRSATSYEQMAKNADFIKPIVYHDAMGPRLRHWVLERLRGFVLNDLNLEQSLQLFYGVFGHDASAMPELHELESNGLGPEYVYREVLRCKQSVSNAAKVYAGIGIDVPWYVPGGMEPRPSDHHTLKTAVKRAFAAGADGVLASREYNEMRMSSLTAFGDAVREHRLQ